MARGSAAARGREPPEMSSKNYHTVTPGRRRADQTRKPTPRGVLCRPPRAEVRRCTGDRLGREATPPPGRSRERVLERRAFPAAVRLRKPRGGAGPAGLSLGAAAPCTRSWQLPRWPRRSVLRAFYASPRRGQTTQGSRELLRTYTDKTSRKSSDVAQLRKHRRHRPAPGRHIERRRFGESSYPAVLTKP